MLCLSFDADMRISTLIQIQTRILRVGSAVSALTM